MRSGQPEIFAQKIAEPPGRIAGGSIRFRAALEPYLLGRDLDWADLVIFCRNIEPGSDWILEECLHRNIPTIYDLDDNLWEVPEGLKYTAYYNAPERIRQMERFLSRVNLVRVYSQPLVERGAGKRRLDGRTRPAIGWWR